ncbi:MAG: tRNA (adenosine(37)-N6)-threonylcarbamoyltransferase complex dimerization subunit type 1 TsaB [Clostridia bacterium]|nr:tRNA (adenosine(37)-N6)-threonylcarbamoyltransferase complex dimerization subunit type 1 TsaB [Clostridia bacterium]MBR6744536.1 tRNA (adenosine(37)-N6)-threonylcarbamoyltransferase complex dimerization subunit type 1 TsaB [Clostridia bacterium]
MKILSLDSSAIVASVALCEDGKLLAEYTINNGNTHSETLLPMVESVLRLWGLKADDVDLFACSAGPGSFTGVRIGAATVKGLAFGRGRPCVGVSTLEAIAENLSLHRGLICPVMNARRQQVYCALFRSDGETLTRLLPDSALSIAELDELLAAYGEEVVFCGDGYDVTLPALTKTRPFPTPERLRHQSAYSVAQVALRHYLAGDAVTDTALAVTYLRPSQAERTRMEREK